MASALALARTAALTTWPAWPWQVEEAPEGPQVSRGANCDLCRVRLCPGVHWPDLRPMITKSGLDLF